MRLIIASNNKIRFVRLKRYSATDLKKLFQ